MPHRQRRVVHRQALRVPRQALLAIRHLAVSQRIEDSFGVQSQHRPARKLRCLRQRPLSQGRQDAPLEAQKSAPADCRLDRAVVGLGAIGQAARIRHIARLHSSSHRVHARASAVQAVCVAVQESPGETSRWRSGEDRGIGDTAGSVARWVPCRAWRHHSQFASRETCCHQRHSRAPCLTRITRPKSLQGKGPSKARSAQHAGADAHTASTVAPRVSAVTRHNGHASFISGCQPQPRATPECGAPVHRGNGVPLWQNRSGALTKMESTNPPEATSCEPSGIQRHMAYTLRTVDEVAQRLRHRALGM